jgi:hypothetical protein
MAKRNAVRNQIVEEDNRDGKLAFSAGEEENSVEVVQKDGGRKPFQGEDSQKVEEHKDQAGGHHIDEHVEEPSEKPAWEEEEPEPEFITKRYVAVGMLPRFFVQLFMD